MFAVNGSRRAARRLMLTSSSAAIRAIGGALFGIVAWPALHFALPVLPTPAAFVIAWFVFTFGTGIAISGWLTDDLDDLRRTIIALGVGTAATPVLIDCLG